eukprot:12442589-Heterocapsa_arctica.AAC.1
MVPPTIGPPGGESIHRLSAVTLVDYNPMEGTSMVMLDAEKKRGGTDLFVSPDGKLAAEFSED